jgi:hypothetical protein
VPPFRQASFSGGELSPSLYGRTDLRQYGEGVRTGRNCIVTPRGSIVNRPGTLYVATCKNTGFTQTPRLIPFVLDDLDTYVLEVGHLYIRFYKNGAQLRTGGNPVEVVTPWAGGDVAQLKFAQLGSTMYFALAKGPTSGNSYTPQILTYVSDTSWTLTALSFNVPAPGHLSSAVGANVLLPLPVGPTTKVTNAAVAQEWQWAVTEVARDTATGIEFETSPTIISESLALGKGTQWDYQQTYAIGAVVSLNYLAQWYTSLTNGNVGNDPITSGANWAQSTTTPPIAAQSSAAAPQTYFLENTEDPSGVVQWDPGATYSAGRFVFLDLSGRWYLAVGNVPVGASPAIYNVLNPTALASGNYWDGPHGPQVLTWTPLGISTGAPAYSGSPTFSVIAWRVYRGRGGIFGLLGQTTFPYFKDYGANPDYTQPPPQGRNPFIAFDANGNPIAGRNPENPGVVGFFQQRLVLGNTQYRPWWFWGSQIGAFTNFDSHLPGEDSDEYEYQLTSNTYEQLRGFLATTQNIFFTSAGGLWIASGSGAPLTRSNIQSLKSSPVGASWNDPIAVGDIALYVRLLGLGVNEVVFDWRVNKFRVNDVTSISRHLFDGHQLQQDWAYQREPYSTVWAVREDGAMVSMTYQSADTPQNEEPLPELKCWTWHDTGPQVGAIPDVPNGQLKQTRDYFLAVCCVHESATLSGFGATHLPPEDAVYVIVERFISGVQQKYVERFYTRQVSLPVPATGQSSQWPLMFLDCGMVLNPVATTTVGGLNQLVGETVYGLADGNVIGPFTVSNAGTIDISGAYPNLSTLPTTLVVGLPYFSDIGLLDLYSQTAELKSARKAVSAVLFEVAASRGIYAGEDFNQLAPADLIPWQERKVSDAFLPSPLKTGYARLYISGTWNYNGRAVLRQVDPLPLELLAVSRITEVGGGP